MIQIAEFPRPNNDNGRGIHWTASPYHLRGSELDFWMDELLAMQIKWVKVCDDGGGSSLELCRRLVRLDIMPVVRLMLGNPGHVQTRNLEAMRRLIDVGALYFETDNEPDLAVEWEKSSVPPNWLEITVDDFIVDADAILGLGGYPAFPAMGVGTIVNPFELIVQRGRQDLFERGAWLAIHNYVINHPFDYPYDAVNQTGLQLTEAEYLAGRWGWDNDPLSVINQLRADGANPGATLYDDATGWRAYELWNEQVVAAFGHSVPIMSTEGGLVVGDRQDGRYPRNDVQRHRDGTLWINQFINSEAPQWYFTVFHWLIANRRMGQDRPGWETQCWYTDWWNQEFGLQGELPTVQALKDAPAKVRNVALADGVLRGTVGARSPRITDGEIRLWAVRDGLRVRETAVMATPGPEAGEGEYRFVGLPSGIYRIEAEGVLGLMAANGLAVWPQNLVNFDVILPSANSIVHGTVVDTAGQPVAMATVLLCRVRRTITSTVTDGEGRYAFGPVAAGEYGLEVPGLQRIEIAADGVAPVAADFVVPFGTAWEIVLTTRRQMSVAEANLRHVFVGRVLNEVGEPIDGVEVEMRWTGADPETVFPRTRTGSDGGKARGHFEFVHTRGTFTVELVGVPWPDEPAEALDTTGERDCYELEWRLERVDG